MQQENLSEEGTVRRSSGDRGGRMLRGLAAALVAGWAAGDVLAQDLAAATVEAGPTGAGLARFAEADTDLTLTATEVDWALSAWAYFGGPSRLLSLPGSPAPPPPDLPFLAPVRSGAAVATPWSVGDQIAALLLAHEFGIVSRATFDRQMSRITDWLGWMTLGPDGMPNSFYDAASGASLGGDLQPGTAGWSAVDTGRLLLWLRVAAVAYPEFAPFIRNGVARLSVCPILSAEGRLQMATLTAEGTQYALETGRGYDAYAAQGYRAWGLDLALPAAGGAPSFTVDLDDVTIPLSEDTDNQSPILTTPPAYLGFELGFESIGGAADEVAAGLGGEELMATVAQLHAQRWRQDGILSARADFRRSEDPTSVVSAVFARGYEWTTVAPDGAARDDLALISTRGVFALGAFAEDENVELLLRLVAELRDPSQGWYEGRYERGGAWETTRSSATNAFVLEALAWRRLGPLVPEEARPGTLGPAVNDGTGACRLPLAVGAP